MMKIPQSHPIESSKATDATIYEQKFMGLQINEE
jgi:hypothetical protein